MMRREEKAREAVEEACQAVIKACTDLYEAEMFLSTFESRERSAVGGAAARVASAADVANTHQSNIREDAQPCKVLPVDRDHEVYAESRLLEAASALQKAIGVSRVIVPADRGEMAESILLSVAEDLNRAVEALGYPTLQVMLGDDVPISQLQHSLMRMSCVVAEKYCSYVENGLRVHASGESGVSTCAECRQAESR
ncbi:hypothetical protein [Schaalia sp. ORNL0103]|uniref:hypothetical protein n=1 Tax=Schaalia sp. ORNL0103 TaxID=2789426 RepID=UPI001CA56DE3|nr:hypothetical protein [Schaalia sp. ORNL0103]MBW6412022.1 hypothetical protein [Schaalia sp. ORNL0103]